MGPFTPGLRAYTVAASPLAAATDAPAPVIVSRRWKNALAEWRTLSGMAAKVAMDSNAACSVARYVRVSAAASAGGSTARRSSIVAARRSIALCIVAQSAGTSDDFMFARKSALAAPMNAARCSFVASMFAGVSKFVWM